uniref:Ferritin n=1 Tax=Ciona intestinalis TaxID=7719 RepID=F6VNH0_CIOIN|nr:ferritin heavy chain [Ciona intestinalis]|eukprot:XP_026690845.1 ferritin heavy chain [Ciona intestinalis]
MKLFAFCVIAVTLSCAYGWGDCHWKILNCAESRVNQWINDQIAVELKGHYTYLYLSKLFERESHYYPKVAKYFRAKSNEEMSHAERFIEYQNQRGGTFDITLVQKKSDGSCANVNSILTGFKCAKELEIDVTDALTLLQSKVTSVQISESCYNNASGTTGNDLARAQPIVIHHHNEVSKPLSAYTCPHQLPTRVTVEYVELTEMIVHEFLGHQIEDTKEIANHVKTLQNIGDVNAGLGSFLVDKHLEL